MHVMCTNPLRMYSAVLYGGAMNFQLIDPVTIAQALNAIATTALNGAAALAHPTTPGAALGLVAALITLVGLVSAATRGRFASDDNPFH